MANKNLKFTKCIIFSNLMLKYETITKFTVKTA